MSPDALPATGGGVFHALRPYQAEAVEAVRAAIRSGKRRVLLVSPTGSGKTQVYLSLVQGALAKGNRVLVLASQVELLEQPGRKLDTAGQDWGMIQADHPRRRPHLPLQLASVQTLARRGVRPEAAVLICDEAHLFVAETFSKIVADYPRAVIVGLTATPRRLDGRGLGEIFDSMVVATTIERSIADGWLVPARTFAPLRPDLSGVSTTGGDYNMEGAAKVMGGSQIVGNIVETWKKRADGHPTIGFGCDISHSKQMVDAFREAGINAAHVDGTTPRDERARLLDDLGSGRITMLWNAKLLTLGIDVPRVSCIIDARPTLSETVYLQQGGRGLRPFEGKPCLTFLDHAGNCWRHGLLEAPREWSLEGKKRSKSLLDAPLRICPRCEAVNMAGASECVACGYVFQKKPREIKHVPGELSEVTKRPPRVYTDDQRIWALARWMKEGHAKGFKPGRAYVIYKARFGGYPSRAIEDGARRIIVGGSGA